VRRSSANRLSNPVEEAYEKGHGAREMISARRPSASRALAQT